MEHFVIVREERCRVVREEQYQYYMAPPEEDPLKIILERLGKRAEQKAYKRPYLHATVVNQQPPMPPKKQTTFAHHEGLHQQKGPNNYVRTGAAHQGHVQEPNTGNQDPPPKKPGVVMDCNEVAKLYGGVVFIDYSRHKFPVPAQSVLSPKY